MDSVLITGAAGFCGRHLCRALTETKQYNVIGTTFHSAASFPPNVVSCKLDIRSSKEVNELLRQIRPAKIIHLAAQSVASKSWSQERETFETNVQGTLNLLEAMRRYVPKAKFLFTSSNLVYGKTFREGQPVTETSLLWPESPYAVSKVTGEMACLNYAAQFNLDIVIARAFNHTGIWQTTDFVFPNWCRQVALAEKGEGAAKLKVGNLELQRDFLHVEDVVRAYELLLENGCPGEIYNVCTGNTHSLRDYAEHLLREARVQIEIEVEKKRLRRYDLFAVSGSPAKLRGLGWHPQKTAFQALHEMLNEWRHRLTPCE